MYKPPIFNRYLNKKWNDKDNDTMVQKLSQAKSSLDKACPESYAFFKKRLKKQKVTIIDTFKEKEVKRNNEILGDKIINIFSVSNKRKLKPLFEFKKQNLSTSRKLVIQKIEMDNQLMLKRLSDQPSCYDKRSWIKDFERSQAYKKNICIFPSIQFYKSKEHERMMLSASPKFFDMTNLFNTPKSRSKTSYQKYKGGNNAFEKLYGSKYFQNTEDSKSKLFQFGYTASNFYKTQNPNQANNNNNSKKYANPFSQANRTQYLILEKNLIYSKKVLLENFGDCYLNFHMENQKFYLCIKPILKKSGLLNMKQTNDPLKKYVILFDKYDESMLSKMDDIINQLVYFPKYDLMYLYREDEDHHRYKSYWIKGNELGQIIKSSNLQFSSDNELEDNNHNNHNNHNNQNNHNNCNYNSNQNFYNKSHINISNPGNEQNQNKNTHKQTENNNYGDKDKGNEQIIVNSRSKHGENPATPNVNENRNLNYYANENKENLFVNRNEFNDDNPNYYSNSNNKLYIKKNYAEEKDDFNDQNIYKTGDGNDRKISQFSDNLSSNKKTSKIGHFVDIGKQINKHSKNKSIKGSHSYQKSQTLNNMDISENKKIYLEENIDDIIQSIEKSDK